MRRSRVTLQEILDGLSARRHAEHCAAVARIAASLPRQRVHQDHGALDKLEAASLPGVTASTTLDPNAGDHGGCCLHGTS